MAENIENNVHQQDDMITLTDLWYLCAANWRWFALSVLVCLSLATIYLLRTEPTYTQQASVMIKEDSKGGSMSSDVASAFSDMGLGVTNSNVKNEVQVFQSPDVVLETIKRINLDVRYSTDGTFHPTTLYGESCPIIASMANVGDDQSCSFAVTLGANKAVTIDRLVLDGEEIEGSFSGKIAQPVKTPAGAIVIMPSAYKHDGSVSKIYVNKLTASSAVDAALANLSVNINSDKNTVIDIVYNDVNINRARDFINTLIAVYNEHWVEDKNQIAVSTSKFINERLRVIESELGNVDADISSYKSANMVPDVKAAGAMYMQEASQATQNMMDLNNQMYMAKTIRSSIRGGNDVNSFSILPANTGLKDAGVEGQINEYNTLLLQRNNYAANGSVENPYVKDLDAKLIALRQAITQSLDNVVNSLSKQIQSMQGYSARAASGIQANPTQAKSLLSVERQQKVKESLYLFLLQKREENELNQAFTAYNTRIVASPHGSKLPTAPIKRNILLVAFVLGLLIPVGIIFLLENFNNKVRGRKDLDGIITMPFLAEIPDNAPRRHFWQAKPKHVFHSIVVADGNRNIINEAFRILRTNLSFLVGNNPHNVMAITSYNPGSGKTFVGLNLAVSLAIKGESVLVIDADLRHASMSKALGLGGLGLSSYLTAQTTDVNAIIHHHATRGLDYIPVGAIPPNPIELLGSPLFGKLIDEVRSRYQYILIDTPPVNLVADTSIIENHVDRTVFVIRAGLLERSMLHTLEADYRANRLKNMALVLNATQVNASGNGYRQGYKYGYGYGYGYHSSGSDNAYYSKD